MTRTPLLFVLFALAVSRAAGAEPIGTLSSPAAPPLTVVRLEGSEAISSLFHYQLELAGGQIPFESLLGQEVIASLPLPGGPTRYFAGFVSRMSSGKVVRLELVPKLWLLTRVVRSRSFQELSVPEIVERVLGEEAIAHQSLLTGDYPRRDCVVQRNESDFAFLSRLLEEEGIFYFFAHAADGSPMVLADTPQAHPSIPGGPKVAWLGTSPRPGSGVTEWTKTQEIRPGKTTLEDFAFQFPDERFESSDLIQESVAAGKVTHRLRLPGSEALEIFEFPGAYAQRFDGEDTMSREAIARDGLRTARLRMQEEATPALRIEGAGSLGQFLSGHEFVLAGHPDADGPYVITGVQHTANARAGRRGGFDFATTFTAIPLGLPFRPARVTPSPILAGVETATVTGPTGSAIHTDEFGRVKVQFHWDREGPADENSSCWIRVGALHAGEESGFELVPQVGDEVVVAFEHGDPDQPIIVGSVYNPDHLPPR